MQKFQQRSLVLFKLLLLEKRVLFFRSPVKDLCGTLLTLVLVLYNISSLSLMLWTR
jgi:hypothetical protein